MLNQIVLVGRLSKEIEIKQYGDKKVAVITLAVPRSFKNANGQYETDYIDCTLWDEIAINVNEYCNVGDVIGIKGRAQNSINNDGSTYLEIIGEKVTFLSSKPKGE